MRCNHSNQHCVIVLLLFVHNTFPTLCSTSTLEPTCPNKFDWRQLTGVINTNTMVMLGASTFHMGSEPPEAIPGDGETPVRNENVPKPFWIDSTEVSVERFRRFVKASKYLTVAEHFGNSFVFWMEEADSPDDLIHTHRVHNKHGPWWWINKKEANWKSVSRRHEKHLPRLRLPVNHVSWDDALAFCEWSGGRLPTEIEWEYACRGGLDKTAYPWGKHLKLNGNYMTNIWQGTFPVNNTRKDEFVLRAPVGSFPSNGYGLHDVAGNVWEWVDGEWSNKSPTGYFSSHVRVQKGGSFLCHRKHCFRYRCSARTKASRDSTSSNVGFRCAYAA